jgi:solute:Na+ symporter, SSS family
MITSYQFKGGGDILHLIFPSLDQTTGMYIIAAFVITFTALAGMASVAYLDLIIGLLVTVIALISLPLLLARTGGWPAVHAALPADHFTVFGPLGWVHCLGYLLPTLLLLIGNQGMYQKFFSARSERDARWAVFGWIAGTLVLETVIITIAVLGSATLHADRPREIIPLTARMRLPELVGAILLGGVFAKVISTANNYLFSPASNLILHRSARQRAPHPARLARPGNRPGRVRLVAGRLLRFDPEGRPLCLHGLRRGCHALGDGGILLEEGQ